MSDVLEPVIQLEKQLETARETAVQTLLRQREGIDEQLKQLGYGKRGRPAKTSGK
jgi:hypothetical protein